MTRPAPDATAVAVAVGEPLGSRVLDGDARLDPVTVPGIADDVVWSVEDVLGGRPVKVYVGAFPDGSARVLNDDPRAWADLAAAAGAQLTDPDEARAYVEAYLEITRGAMVIVVPVASLDDLRWRPGSDGEEAARAALLADPPDVAPVAAATAEGFRVELTLVVDQRLQRNRFDVGRAGEIAASYHVLAEGLPLPVAR